MRLLSEEIKLKRKLSMLISPTGDLTYNRENIITVSSKFLLDSSFNVLILNIQDEGKWFISKLMRYMPKEDAIMLAILCSNTYRSDEELTVYKRICKADTLDQIFNLFIGMKTLNTLQEVDRSIVFNTPLTGIRDITKTFHMVDPSITSKLVLMGIVTPTNRGN